MAKNRLRNAAVRLALQSAGWTAGLTKRHNKAAKAAHVVKTRAYRTVEAGRRSQETVGEKTKHLKSALK